MNVMTFLEKRSKPFWFWVASVTVILLGLIDYYTGYELSFSLFYLAPIFLATWFMSKRVGLLFSVISAVTWIAADYLSGNRYSHPPIYIWNTLIRMAFFVIVTLLLSALRTAYEKNRSMAQVDFVSGAVSAGYFYSVAKNEIERSARYKKPFSFAYIDLDNFKQVNDSFGHSTGDHVLRAVTESIQGQIRQTDTFARLGGDEFALLLPETGEEKARSVITRIHSILTEEMSKNGWGVTFSIGAVTYSQPPASVDEMVKATDAVMYSVKISSKNGVAYQLHVG